MDINKLFEDEQNDNLNQLLEIYEENEKVIKYFKSIDNKIQSVIKSNDVEKIKRITKKLSNQIQILSSLKFEIYDLDVNIPDNLQDKWHKNIYYITNEMSIGEVEKFANKTTNLKSEIHKEIHTLKLKEERKRKEELARKKKREEENRIKVEQEKEKQKRIEQERKRKEELARKKKREEENRIKVEQEKEKQKRIEQERKRKKKAEQQRKLEQNRKEKQKVELQRKLEQREKTKNIGKIILVVGIFLFFVPIFFGVKKYAMPFGPISIGVMFISLFFLVNTDD